MFYGKHGNFSRKHLFILTWNVLIILISKKVIKNLKIFSFGKYR